MRSAHAARHAGWLEPLGALGAAAREAVAFVDQMLTVAEAEVRKMRHDPAELFTRAVQPTLWLVVFGQVMHRLRAIPTGDMAYLDFLAPGILAQSVLFIAIFYGISLIWERDLGILHKYLVSPACRSAIVAGKALSAGVRALSQVVIVYGLALAMGVRLNLTAGAVAGVLLAVLLGAAIFSTFSLLVACLVKTRERFMGIGQVLTMPLFFASNAIYPLSSMPDWLKVVSTFNPLTYQVDALRALMVVGGHPTMGLGLDFAVQAAVLLCLVALASRLYPNAIQ